MSAPVRLAGFYFFYFCYLGAFAAYFALWLAGRGHTAAEIAAVLALPQFVRVAAPAVWGWLADAWGERFPGGRRGIVALASFLAAASFGALALVQELGAVFACVALMAFFSSGVLPLVEATALAALEGHTERYGSVRLWGSLGFIASVFAVGVMLDRAPVSQLLPMVSGLMVLAALAALALPPVRAVPAGAGTAGLGRVLAEPRVRALFGACFSMSVAHGALYAFYTLYLVQTGYATSTVGLLWTLGVLAEIGLFLALPQLLRRCSLRALLLASFGAAAVRFAAIGWAVESFAVLAAAQLLHALTFGAYHAAALSAVHRLFPGALELRGQALYASLSYGLGGAVGMLLAGWTWGALGPALTFTVSAAFGLAGGALVAWKVRV